MVSLYIIATQINEKIENLSIHINCVIINKLLLHGIKWWGFVKLKPFSSNALEEKGYYNCLLQNKMKTLFKLLMKKLKWIQVIGKLYINIYIYMWKYLYFCLFHIG